MTSSIISSKLLDDPIISQQDVYHRYIYIYIYILCTQFMRFHLNSLWGGRMLKQQLLNNISMHVSLFCLVPEFHRSCSIKLQNRCMVIGFVMDYFLMSLIWGIRIQEHAISLPSDGHAIKQTRFSNQDLPATSVMILLNLSIWRNAIYPSGFLPPRKGGEWPAIGISDCMKTTQAAWKPPRHPMAKRWNSFNLTHGRKKPFKRE